MAKKKKKTGRGPKKGGRFEREICKLLSKWWSNGERNDIFWRSQSSGARATQRSKSGQRTRGQYGDIAATDPNGAPLLDVVTIELKNGYNKHTLLEFVDAPPEVRRKSKWNQWIQQAMRASQGSGSYSWMIISKRDFREPVVVFPLHLAEDLGISPAHHTVVLSRMHIAVLQLREFLTFVTPEKVLYLQGKV